MRFIHFADTHLGFSDLSKIDPTTGVNRREQDFYEAWHHIIEAILAERPDFVLHAGDLFQSPRPNNRAIAIALSGLSRLNDAGIPFVVIAGNHSTPRIRATGNIFEALRILPNVHAAYSGVYEKFIIRSQTNGSACAIHCIPHCSLSEELERAYAGIELDHSVQWNILLAHGSWRAAGKIDTRMGEFNEQFLEDPETLFNLRFDYIALGHYHRFIPINDHTYYSGSTERTSFNEAGYTSGYIRGDLPKREWSYTQIPSRPMRRLQAIDCCNKTLDKLMLELKLRSSEDSHGALLTLEFRGMSRDLYLQLDFPAIDKLFHSALHLEKSFQWDSKPDTQEAQAYNGNTTGIGSLQEEFSRYLTVHSNGAFPREEIEKLAAHYLADAESLESEA